MDEKETTKKKKTKKQSLKKDEVTVSKKTSKETVKKSRKTVADEKTQKEEKKSKPVQSVLKEEKEKNEKEEVREVIVEKKCGFNMLEVLIIMFITLCFGGLLGSALTYAMGSNGEIITSIPEDLKEFINTYEDITANYYEEIDQDGLLAAGIQGMIGFLGDKYSVYMNKTEADDFNMEIEGKYVGIGTEIMLSEETEAITISNPFPGGPAEEVGLMAGDVILKVDGEDVGNLDITQVSEKVKGKGKAGTKVQLTVQRGEETIVFDIERREVELTSVTSKMVDLEGHKVGYINISIFAANTKNQFEKQLLSLEAQGMESLIIDVRSNNGGYLTTVTDIVSLFLEKGKTIYQLDTKGLIEVTKDKTKTKRDYPVVVLTNSSSASASEILAAAFKESYANGCVMGTNTYGKGTVQKAYDLKNGATVKYTIQKWLTPSGNWIEGTGVEPNYEVAIGKDYYDHPTEENDQQLQAALKFAIGDYRPDEEDDEEAQE